MKGFVLYITTKLPNPAYTPEVRYISTSILLCSNFELINLSPPDLRPHFHY